MSLTNCNLTDIRHLSVSAEVSRMSAMFPSLTPRATDPLWFSVDRPADEEAELAREEAEHQAVGGVQNRAANYPPVFTFLERPLLD